MEGHRKSNLRLMGDNLALIKEIKRQRDDNKADKHALQAAMGVLQRNGVRKPLTALTMGTPTPTAPSNAATALKPPPATSEPTMSTEVGRRRSCLGAVGCLHTVHKWGGG